MKKQILIISACVSLIAITSGCAGARAGVNAARITVNKAFDTVDKGLATVENVTAGITGGAKETVSTATSSQ